MYKRQVSLCYVLPQLHNLFLENAEMPELRDSRGVIRVPVRVLSPRHRMQIRHQENLILAAKGKQPVHIAKALFLIYPRILIINKKPVAERHAQQIHPGFLQEKEILLDVYKRQVGDGAALDLIKTVDQVDNRRLSRACGAYEGYFLAGLCIKADAV